MKYGLRSPIFFLLLILTSLACGLASPASNSPAVNTVQPVAPTATIQTLTAEQIKNAQYQLGARDDHAVVQMANGKYQEGTDATTLNFAYIALTDFVSIGDLNGDGVNEAAAIFSENYGGTGNFAFLAIYKNAKGSPVFLYSAMIEDRPMINSMHIENGEVFLDVTIHAVNDPACCPSLPNTRRYALVNNQLGLMNYTTSTPNGAKREIEINSPVNEEEVSGSLQVSGKVSIAPFENNLSYVIYAESNKQLASGPVAVTAPDLGAPGTFNESIDLSGIPAGTIIYLEIQDLSAADGSLLALDVVKLVVK